tara:strand:- start:1493 stop:2386 length:894 start_codon:yes stop_codon:yes gene_type:complete
MALKSFRDIVHELKMKRDKKLPNLKTPVKGPKGTSRFSRFKSASKSTTSSASLGTKNALSAGTEYPTEESVDQLDEKLTAFSKVMRKNKKLISNDHNTVYRNYKFYVIIDDDNLADLSTMDSERIFRNLKKNKGIGYPEGDITCHFKTAKDANQFVDDMGGPGSMYGKFGRLDVVGESVDEATWPDEMPPVDEELSISARRKLSRLMKRRKTQLKRSRLRARKRMAKTDVLKKRARRGARADAAKKLAKGKDKKDLSIAMKKSLEKRLAMPAVQRRIKTMTRRMMPTKRKLEISRKR